MIDRTSSRSTPAPRLSIRVPRARLVALALLCLWTLAGCEEPSPVEASTESGTRPPDAIAVRVSPVRIESISSLYATSETLRAEKHAIVIARTAGIIEKLLVEEGDSVQEGQPLAELEDDEHRIAAEQAKTSFEIRQRELERIRKLHEDGILTETDLSDAQRQADEAKHAADLADLTLSRTIVRAPFSGTIVERHLDVGATVSNGTSVYELADLDPLNVDVRIPERHVARLASDQRARVTSQNLAQPISARILRISPAVDPKTSTVKVTLAIDGAPPELRPGGFVRVAIVTDTVPQATIVPRSALVAEGRRWQIFRLVASGSRVERLEVERGYEEGERVQILRVVGEATLNPGDQVVSLGASALKDGSPVLVRDAEASTGPDELSQHGEDSEEEGALTATDPRDEG